MMAEIKNAVQYQKLLDRVEELLQVVGNQTLPDDQNFIVLDILSNLVVEYEEKSYPMVKPPLSAIIRQRKK